MEVFDEFFPWTRIVFAAVRWTLNLEFVFVKIY
jgi:hypothetical protein